MNRDLLPLSGEDHAQVHAAYTKNLLESLLAGMTPGTAARTLRVVSDMATLQLQALSLLDPGGSDGGRRRDRMRHEQFGNNFAEEDGIGATQGMGAGAPQDMTAHLLEEGLAMAAQVAKSNQVKLLTDAYVRAKTLENDTLADALRGQLDVLLGVVVPVPTVIP